MVVLLILLSLGGELERILRLTIRGLLSTSRIDEAGQGILYMCCWLAALGAGLLKSEEILEGVASLRISNDIEFEEETFIAMMNEAREKRAKLNVPAPAIPMEARVEKAFDAIHVCCFGRDPIEEEDERILCIMLKVVFPSVSQPEIDRLVKAKAKT